MRNAALADSGPLLALFDRSDAHHRRVSAFLRDHPDMRLLTTLAVVTETAALLAARVGHAAQLDFLEWVERGGLAVVELEPGSLRRVIETVRKYRDLPFDFADATLAEAGARLGIDAILSVDRDFDIYRTKARVPLKNLLGHTAPRAKRRASRRN